MIRHYVIHPYLKILHYVIHPTDYLKLNGYHTEFQNRDKKRGGGVCLYIKDGIKYKVRDDLAKLDHPNYVESLFIEIEKSGLKNIVVGVMYRPPDQDVNEFNEFIDSLSFMSPKIKNLCT